MTSPRTLSHACALLAAALLTGCLMPAPTEADSGEISGGRGSSLQAIGVLRVSLPEDGRFCTATLIAPRVVLTARACLRRVTSPSQVSFAPDFGGQGVPAAALFHTVPLDDLSRPPVYGMGAADDIALVVLTRAIEGADTRDVRRAPLDASFVGRTVVLAGFGPSDRERFDHGSRLLGTNQITEIGESTFSLDPSAPVQPCYGDAGGPVFSLAEVVGVISPVFVASPPEEDWLGRMHPRNCRPATYTRVDRYLELVDRALAWEADNPTVAVTTDEPDGEFADTSCVCDEVCGDIGDCCPECGAV